MKKICCLLLLICWGCLESVKAFNYDYSQTWVSKMFLSKPDPKGGCIVNLTFQINYQREWEAGYTQMRIDKLLALIPELKEAGTIHSDVWIARPSEGHNETVICEALYQQKAALY